MMMFVIKHVITHYSIRFYDREKWSSRSVICFKKYSSYSIEYPTSLLEYISCTGDIDQRESRLISCMCRTLYIIINLIKYSNYNLCLLIINLAPF